MDISDRLKQIKLLIMDVDGVLTDGRLYFTEQGETIKVFDVRDGLGLTLLHARGVRSGIISGRSSPIVERRLRDLGVEYIWQGREDKVAALHELIAAAGVDAADVAYIGDDTIDLPVFPLVGLAVAVGDAHEAIKPSVHLITNAHGGRGAVRELIDMILSATK